jgi:aspartyl-tRNA(Asn)/glutamyl-tRNA(Gln) amidotransferase subunit A
MEALTSGFESQPLESLDEVSVGVAWLERADPLVRERVSAAAALLPRARPLDLPFPEGTSVVFMREVADVHRELFRAHADSYGDNVRIKVERCLEVRDSAYERGLRALEQYRERVAEAVAGVDLVLTPTLPCVAPPVEVDDLDVRERIISLTYPFNCLGWPALALPCGAAEDGLPASVQLAGANGADGLVLAAGRELERMLADQYRSPTFPKGSPQ